jgi:hypothetical protein
LPSASSSTALCRNAAWAPARTSKGTSPSMSVTRPLRCILSWPSRHSPSPRSWLGPARTPVVFCRAAAVVARIPPNTLLRLFGL